MPRTKRWTEETLRTAVAESLSIRQVLIKLKLVEAGGNYDQIKKYIFLYKIDTLHFLGKASNRGKKIVRSVLVPTKDILVKGSNFQSFKLKQRLFNEGIKTPFCEVCGWAKVSKDGRIPVELDHINGDRKDNRLENLRILCPNCHSLQITHRGKNKKKIKSG
jgi:hypothetical protein